MFGLERAIWEAKMVSAMSMRFVNNENIADGIFHQTRLESKQIRHNFSHARVWSFGIQLSHLGPGSRGARGGRGGGGVEKRAPTRLLFERAQDKFTQTCMTHAFTHAISHDDLWLLNLFTVYFNRSPQRERHFGRCFRVLVNGCDHHGKRRRQPEFRDGSGLQTSSSSSSWDASSPSNDSRSLSTGAPRLGMSPVFRWIQKPTFFGIPFAIVSSPACRTVFYKRAWDGEGIIIPRSSLNPLSWGHRV